MHFSCFSFFGFGFFFWFLKFIALKYFPLYRILCLIRASLSLFFSCYLVGNVPFLFRFLALFNFNIKTYDPSYISGVWKCSCVVLVCVLLCIISTLSLSHLILLFLLVYLFFFSCYSECLLSIVELDYSSTLRSKVKITKKKHIVDYICQYSSHSWC